jgi:hypothetical protein
VARIRSIKPEFWQDRKLAIRHSRDARLFYIGLWSHADEHSRMLGDPRLLKSEVFPYDEDLDVPAIVRLLAELIDSGRVVPYEIDGEPYLLLPKLAAHQRLEPVKVPSRLPVPPPMGEMTLFDDDLSALPALGAHSSGRGADTSALAPARSGSRLHVAGSRLHVQPSADESARFDEFWAVYPRRVAKEAAKRAWAKAIKLAAAAEIIAGARAYAAVPGREPKYTKHPATWLHGGCWQDERDAERHESDAVSGWEPN